MGPQRGVMSAEPCADCPRDRSPPVASSLGREATFTPILTPRIRKTVCTPSELLRQGGLARDLCSGPGARACAERRPVYRRHPEYAESIVAITAPASSPISAWTPHRWSAAFNNLGFRDREATYGSVPGRDMSDIQPADSSISSSAPHDAQQAHICSSPPSARRDAGDRKGLPTPPATRARPFAA